MSVLFVYGTLRPGQRAHDALGACRVLGPARTQPHWTLMDLGPYPALVAGGQSAVTGDLVEVDPKRLPALDRYEGASYSRRAVELLPPHAGVVVEAWVWVAPLPAAARPIESGDWLVRP